ncbi:MAG: hypothetical protein ACE366_31930 [Bradymonadia bacterium]
MCRMRCLMAVVVLMWGCDEDFEARTLLEGYRVMGISADRPEVGLEDTVTLHVHDFDTEGRPPTYRWSVCMASVGAENNFECVDETWRFSLEGARTLTVDFERVGAESVSLSSIYEQALSRYGGMPSATGIKDLEEGFDVLFTLNSGPEGGREVETVKRVTVRSPAREEGPNTNPEVSRFSVEAVARASTSVELAVEVTDGSAQPYVLERYGEDGVVVESSDATEELAYTWYTTAGETDPPVTFGDVQRTTLKLPAEAGLVRVFVTVRDGRGGLDVAEAEIEVRP